jgi:AraC-like DNA-binding protein
VAVSAPHVYRSTVPGVETLAPGLRLGRHRHAWGYATVVLAGSFVEASFAGRFTAEPGDVLLHAAFDCHCNWSTSRQGPQILRLPWSSRTLEGHFRVRDPDLLVRLSERDPAEATRELRRELEPVRTRQGLHWTDKLAADLSRDSSVALRIWAEREGIAPETLSRGFRCAFGVSPRRFRLEARARSAWVRLGRSDTSLTAIAHDLEFSDLAHMSRSVAAFTGLAPSVWRRAADDMTLLHQVRSSPAPESWLGIG